MKKKKQILCLLLAGMALFGVAACGQKGTEAQTAESTESSVKTVASVDDLSGARIGVQLGTTGDIYVSDYEGDGSGTVVERYNKGADAVQALRQGKIDCVVIDEQPAMKFVEQNSGLKILEEEFTLEDYAFLMAKENEELLTKINGALAELGEEGVLDEIKKNYVGAESEIGKYPYEPADTARPNGTLVVATNAEFPPYEYYEDGKITGMDIDIMQAVCDKLGMELKVEDMAFDSIIPAIASGKADVGASGFTVTEERKKNVNFSDTYTTSKQVVSLWQMQRRCRQGRRFQSGFTAVLYRKIALCIC